MSKPVLCKGTYVELISVEVSRLQDRRSQASIFVPSGDMVEAR